MTDQERIKKLEAEVAILRQTVYDLMVREPSPRWSEPYQQTVNVPAWWTVGADGVMRWNGLCGVLP